MRKIVEVRSQHSRGSSRRFFGGPDTYVAVQVVPDGVEPLKALNRTVAQRRGIVIHYFGEGYRKYSGPRSALGKALAAARAFAGEEPRT